MYWLGIDGGGTKTACTLFDNTLEPLDTMTLATCHYAQAGFDGMRDVLAEGVRWAHGRCTELAAADGTAIAHDPASQQTAPGTASQSAVPAASTAPELPAHELGIGFGICGFGEGADSTERIADIAASVAGAHPHIVVNDVEAAWAAGLDMADGIAIIAGTGSIALGVCGERQMRCGGWDYELGDEGSGGWLGKEALRTFTRQADGRDPRGVLYRLMREELSLRDDFDIIAFAQEHYANRGRISALAPLVSAAARQGDESARAIFERAAQEEADMARAIVDALFCANGARPAAASIPVTYIGGTFAAGDLILQPLAAALPACCRLVEPRHAPDIGAVLILRERLQAGPSPESTSHR